MNVLDVIYALRPTDCGFEMIPVETTTANWKWQMGEIPIVNITDSTPSQKVNKGEYAAPDRKIKSGVSLTFSEESTR